jgi:hypothetical protein
MGGGTIRIPAGTWDWNTFTQFAPDNYNATVLSYGGVSIIGAGIGQTILMQTQSVPATGEQFDMLAVDGTNGKQTTISGITFQGYTSYTNETAASCGVDMLGATDYRITNCSFDSFTNDAINAENVGSGVNRGVIDHCAFSNSYKNNTPPVGTDTWYWGYGVIVWDSDYTKWSNINTLLGQYTGASDIAYIENNNFTQMRHAVSESQNGYYVFRFNIVANEIPNNFGSIDVHGENGGRGCEAYNNTVIATPGYVGAQAVWMRGGTDTVFNNTFINCMSGVSIYIESAYGNTGYNTTDDKVYDSVWNTYIWGNTMIGGGTVFSDQSNGAYTQNVDYFLYARPNYTPYTYPNPLMLQPIP